MPGVQVRSEIALKGSEMIEKLEDTVLELREFLFRRRGRKRRVRTVTRSATIKEE